MRFIDYYNNLNLPCSNAACILTNDISEYLPHSRKCRCISWLSYLVIFMIDFVLSITFTTVLCIFYVILFQNHSVKWGNYSCKIKCSFIHDHWYVKPYLVQNIQLWIEIKSWVWNKKNKNAQWHSLEKGTVICIRLLVSWYTMYTRRI